MAYLFTQVAKHHGKSKKGTADSKSNEVAEKSVGLNPTDWQCWDCHEQYIVVLLITKAIFLIWIVTGVEAYYFFHLLGDKVKVRTARGKLLDPDWYIHSHFSPFTKDMLAYLTIAVGMGIPFGHL